MNPFWRASNGLVQPTSHSWKFFEMSTFLYSFHGVFCLEPIWPLFSGVDRHHLMGLIFPNMGPHLGSRLVVGLHSYLGTIASSIVHRPLGFGPGGVLEALERKLLESHSDGGIFGGLRRGVRAGQGSSTVWVGADIHGDNLRLDHPPPPKWTQWGSPRIFRISRIWFLM